LISRLSGISLLKIKKMRIDVTLLDELTAQAKVSPRLRMNFDLRNSPNDQSQRMLNALEPGTVMPIHRHRHSSETVVVLRGKVKWVYYNDQKEITDTFIVAPGSDLVGLSVPMGQWHSLECLETGTVIFESKDGAFEPTRPEDVLS
jgi:cupin fold WbuC family metalloprotein